MKPIRDIISISLDSDTKKILQPIGEKRRSEYIRDLIKANVNILPPTKVIVRALQDKRISYSELLEFTITLKNICEANSR